MKTPGQMKFAKALILSILLAPFAHAGPLTAPPLNPQMPNFMNCVGGRGSATQIQIRNGQLKMAGAGPTVVVTLKNPSVTKIDTYKNENDLTPNGVAPLYTYTLKGYTVTLLATQFSEIPGQYSVGISKGKSIGIFGGYCYML